MKLRIALLTLLLPLAAFGQKKISEFPNLTTLASNQLFVVTSANGTTNNNFSFGQLTNQIRDASGMTNLNATQLLSGTVPDARLSGNVFTRTTDVLTNNRSASVTLSDLTATTLTTTTFNVTTQNIGTIVLTNVDGSFWTNLTVANITSPGYIVTNANANVFKQAAELDATGTTNYVSGSVRLDAGVYSPTNMTATADFSKRMTWTNIGAAFTMAAPIGVDGTKTMGQSTIWQITNNTAAAVLVTAPGSVRTYWWGTNVSGFYVTNYAPIFVMQYGGALTNAFVGPGF